MRTAKFLLIAVWFILHGVAMAADAQPYAAGIAQISFTFDFPGSTPDHYSLTIDSDGHGTYVSGRPQSAKPFDADADSDSQVNTPYRYEFTVSGGTKARIFDLAKHADYFKGNLDYGKGRIASTGAKTLAYKDGSRSTQATYNYSNKPAVGELTRVFQGLAATIEFGQRLDYLHHYQKLALDEELKRMEEMAKAGQLEEIQAVASILKHIVDDSTVMNVSRARAERILATGSTNTAGK